MLLSDITALNNDSIETYGATRSIITVIVLAFAPFVLYYSYSIRKVRKWENSLLDRKGEKTDANFALAYIILIGMMLKQDPREYETKRHFLKKVLAHFSTESIDLDAIFLYILQKDVRVKHVAKWTNLRLSDIEREELMYTLIETVYIDESLVRKEMSLLLDFVRYTHISKRDLDSMMASHKQRLAREAEEARQKAKKERYLRSAAYKREKAFEILGVSPYAGNDEIRKAYLALVKKHHPDRFYGKEASLIQAARARFIEIQKAYELITT